MTTALLEITPREILDFWFVETEAKLWFTKNEAFDRQVAERFRGLHARAAVSELEAWRSTIDGRLAEILVLDQFSRNMYRGDPRSFAHDPLALALAQEAVRTGRAGELEPIKRSFLYMPYMHSESLAVHERALELFAEAGLESNLDFEKRHVEILRRFGRYPHRNSILGRQSTPEETAFLREPGSSF